MADGNGPGVAALKSALALSVSMLSAEHVFSSSLSSPLTTSMLTETENDEAAFWKLFTQCVIASYAFAIVTGWILMQSDSKRDWRPFIWALGGTTAIVIWLYFDYKAALDGTLYDPNAFP